ncbi:MAG: TRAP transporter small permease [Alphaproteobacteria bacterium]|nr:TRAP transporter small permease [Alphaproteobacteria bacterium]MBU1548555.1 TRAP transporter small permease [Alphaproteobacteria bacterium]MBU2337751.1 TRAP transporter small permease [Alphaproteobacteria bacterium]MBU2389888.1 TRAP transporter small permease [Alphaproteobacteria bacterium]
MQADTISEPDPSPLRRRLQGGLNIIAAVGTVWIFAIMLLIVADVVGRNFLAAPITGVAEIAARSVVAIVFLMLPAAVLNGSLVRADFLLRLVESGSERLPHALDFVFAVVGTLLFGALAVAAWPDTASAWRTAEFFGVRGVWTLPTFPFRLIIVFGSAASALAFAVLGAESLGRLSTVKARPHE